MSADESSAPTLSAGDSPAPALSAVSGADPKATSALAWRVVESLALGSLQNDEQALRLMRALYVPPRSPLDPEPREQLMAWATSGAALAYLRASLPLPARARILSRVQLGIVRERLHTWSDPERRVSAPLSDEARELFRLLVGVGFSPREAMQRLGSWNPWTGEFPDGQWMPEGAVPTSPTRAVNVVGVRLSPALFMQVRQQLWTHPKSHVRSTLVEARGLSSEAAERVIAALGNGWSVGVELTAEEASDLVDATLRAKVERCVRSLLAEYPLHWAILARTELRESYEHETMWVQPNPRGQGILLSIHPDFVSTLSDRQCMAVLLHELHHVLFAHLREPPTSRAGTPESRAHAWTLACECTANEHIALPLPYDPITLEALGLPPNESTEQRYLRLVRSAKKLQIWQAKLTEARHTCERPQPLIVAAVPVSVKVDAG